MLPRMIVALGLASALAAGEASAQGPITASARARIDSIFAGYDRGSPGCALGVYHDGAIVLARGYGLASLEYGVAITPAMPFLIGSLTKQFTAAAVILLEEQGRLAPGDDLRRYVPGLPAYAAGITVDELIHHTSGLRDFPSLMELAGGSDSEVYTFADVLQMLARQHGLNFPPGSRYAYSGTGSVMLERVAQTASGVPLRTFMADRIFRPLGMTSTQVRVEHTLPVRGLAESYSAGPDRAWHIDEHILGVDGQGSMITTIDDLARWDRNFTSGTVGGPAFLARQVEPGRLADGTVLTARLGDGRVLKYAAGLFLGEYRGLPTVEHSGDEAGYRSGLIRFPTAHTSVALLCNRGDADPIALLHRVADVVLGSAFPEPATAPAARTPPVSAAWVRPAAATPVPPERRAALAGRYYSAELDVRYELAVTGGQMTLSRPHRPATPLVPQADGSYRFRSARLDFLPPDPDGRARFAVGGGGAFGIEFVRGAGAGAGR